MTFDDLVFGVRVLLGVIAFGLAWRLFRISSAYRSWRVYFFLGLTGLAFGADVWLHIAPGEFAERSLLQRVFEIVLVAGVVGILYETWQSDQHRSQDWQRMVDQSRLTAQLAEARSQELEMLASVNRELAASLNLSHVLKVVADKAREFGKADGVGLFIRDVETGGLTDYQSLPDLLDESRPRLAAPQTINQAVAETGDPTYVADAAAYPVFAAEADPELRALASLPLKAGDVVVGVMNVGYRQPFDFSDTPLRLLGALADAAALAVQNAEQHERIRRQAVTDELTGLANRRRFLEVLRGEMARARRYGHPLSLLMVDLDRLKQINDQNGHAAGDAMLRGVALCLRACLRTTDLPARLGGDEFAVLMPETPRESALLVAERIRAAVEGFRASVDGKEIRSTVSLGVMSRAVGRLQDLPSFLHDADDALYRAKSGGRNRVTVWEPPEASISPAIDSPANSE